jgi:hypothetical protein
MSDDEKAARLQKALIYGGDTHSIADVAAAVRNGEARLFENDGGVIVAQLNSFPRLKTVSFWLIFGELKACLALEHEVLPWAVESGATVATACGRPGWGRVAAPTGWKPWRPNFYKTLVGEDRYCGRAV